MLDNQYIYKNLVAQLREIKEKRQVIIATHNSTLVTNAKADQVCLMCSDNEHGWYISFCAAPALLFILNSKEYSSSCLIYMSKYSFIWKTFWSVITPLSLGQKVVAMMTFILGYSDYSGDYRPLIIDQPEDNLDNQYIYKNLVAQLRQAV